MLGMRFMNNRKDGKDYGRIAKVERCDEKGKSVTLMYEDGNGGTTVSTATLKRWWKSVQKEEVMVEQQELDTTDVIVEDDKCGDGTPLVEVGKHIAEQAKQKVGKHIAEQAKQNTRVHKKERIKKEMKEKAPVFDSQQLRQFIISYVDTLGGTIKERKKNDGTMMCKVALKIDGHMFATMSWSRKTVSVNVRSSIEYSEPTKVFQNTIFGAHYMVSEDTDTVREMIQELLKKAADDQLNRKAKKDRKEV